MKEFADAATALIEPINAFFDEVLVMADDPDIRTTRLGLLASIYELAGTVLDWESPEVGIGLWGRLRHSQSQLKMAGLRFDV